MPIKNRSFIGIFITFCLLLQMKSLDAQQISKGYFSLSAGLNRSRLIAGNDKLTPVTLPLFGLNYHYNVAAECQLTSQLSYSIIGGNYDSPYTKWRNHSINLSAGPRIRLFDFLILDAVFEYSYLLSQLKYQLDGGSPSGVSHTKGEAYHNQFSLFSGLGITMQKGIDFGIRYKISTSESEFSSLQFLVSFNFNLFSRRPARKECKNFETALKYPADFHQLILHRQDLDSLSGEVGNLTLLTELFLDGNDLVILPPEVGRLNKLEKLSVRNNQLTSLPDSLTKLSNLAELYLDYNKLKELPEDIGRLKNLRFLHLSNNFINRLPASIGELTNLVELDISNNQALLLLPTEIEKLRNLELLIVDQSTQFPIPFVLPNARLVIVVVQ